MTASHHDIAVLLPWYVNGTLNEAEMATVQRHIATCAECREAVRREVNGVCWTPTAGDDHRLAVLNARRDQAFEALQTRIGGAVSDTDGSISGTARPRSRRIAVRWLPALAAVLVAALAGPMLWTGRVAEPTMFDLRTTRISAESPVLQIVFRDGTSAEDIELVIRTSGTVLAGPTPHGIYRIALSTEDPQGLLQRLRAHPAVRWAEIEL